LVNHDQLDDISNSLAIFFNDDRFKMIERRNIEDLVAQLQEDSTKNALMVNHDQLDDISNSLAIFFNDDRFKMIERRNIEDLVAQLQEDSTKNALTSTQSANHNPVVDRLNQYYQILNKWLRIKQRIHNLSEVLLRQGYRNIAIYGAGELGKNLFGELQQTPVKVHCFINQGVFETTYIEYLDMKIQVMDMQHFSDYEKENSIDAVVVSPIFDFAAIKDSLEQNMIESKTISLETLVDDVENVKCAEEIMESQAMLWQHDIHLLQLLQFDTEKIKLISCDIFDTLIFRTTVTPHDIFLVLGQEAKEKGLIKNIEPEEFKELRIIAEKKAQSKKEKEQGTIEANLYEIYDQMPFDAEDKEKLLELELLTEKKCIYLNPSIASMLRYYYEKGVSVVLLSDMYLSRQQVEDLLVSVGFDCDILDDIIISSQYLVAKWNGGLYQVLLDKYPHISPSAIVHIGDNYQSDVINALSCGIHAIHYNSRQDSGKAFELERYYKNALIPELFFLRKLAGSLSGGIEAGRRFWFEFGATILGPFLSVVTEWVVDNAINDNIKRIYPLMRKGMIISEFIKNSLKERNIIDITVRPLYVSRRSSFLSFFDDIDETVIKDYIMAQSWSPLVSGIFTQLKLDNVYERYGNVKLPDTHEIIMESGKTLFQEITEYLCRPDTIGKIRETMLNDQKLFSEYLIREYGMDCCPFMTVDIGYNGTIQAIIDRVLHKMGCQANGTHLLFIGKYSILDKIVDGMDIRGYINEVTLCKSFQSNHWTPELVESLLAECVGTTVGYQWEDSGKIVPILENTERNLMNKEEREICRQGMLVFQKLFLDVIKIKPWLKEAIGSKRKQLFDMAFLRFMEYPTLEEAKNLGNLYYEDSFRGGLFEPYCPEHLNEMVRKLGPSAFLKEEKVNVNVWMAGVVERTYPNYFRIQLIKQADPNGNLLKMLRLAQLIYKKNIKEVIVYGAGELGREMVRTLKLMGIRIKCIVDKKSVLWDNQIEGVKICPVDSVIEPDMPTIVVASCAFVQEIRDTVEQMCSQKGIQVDILDCFQINSSD